jgi:hypothetical protein
MPGQLVVRSPFSLARRWSLLAVVVARADSRVGGVS